VNDVARVIPKKKSVLAAVERVRAACADLMIELSDGRVDEEFAIQYHSKQNTVVIIDVRSRTSRR
jgi:hypothetical protein